MTPFSLLQLSLDQTIDRESLEEASVAARSVARADCAKMQRELHGILISGLEREEAVSFQAELKRRNFPTAVVADHEIPLLHETFSVHRVEVKGEILLFTDAMGRVHPRPLTDLVFLAAGHVNRVAFKTITTQRVDLSARGTPTLVSERQSKEETTGEFLLDFFFWAAPNRFRLRLAGDTTIFYNGKAMRLRQEDEIAAMAAELRQLLPPERTNNGLKRGDNRFPYPSPACFEKEIRWHFYQLKSKG